MAALGRSDVLELLEEYSKDGQIEVSETCLIGARRVKWYHSDEGQQTLARLPARYMLMRYFTIRAT